MVFIHSLSLQDLSQILMKPAFGSPDTKSSKALDEVTATDKKADNLDCLSSLDQFINETQKELQREKMGDNSLIGCTPEFDTLAAEGVMDLLNRSMQSLFSQENDIDKKSTVNDEIRGGDCVSPAPDGSSQPKTAEPGNQLLSLDISAIDQPVSKPATSQKTKKCRRRIKGNVNAARHAETKPSLPPTSTPLRKSSEVSRSSAKSAQLPLSNQTGSTLNCVNDSKDSGFPLENVSNDQKLNNSILIQSIRHKELSDQSTLSSHSASVSTCSQTLKILVQWKNRVLLIPSPR